MASAACPTLIRPLLPRHLFGCTLPAPVGVSVKSVGSKHRAGGWPLQRLSHGITALSSLGQSREAVRRSAKLHGGDTITYWFPRAMRKGLSQHLHACSPSLFALYREEPGQEIAQVRLFLAALTSPRWNWLSSVKNEPESPRSLRGDLLRT